MTLLSQVPHLRMSGLLLSASFPPKPHAEADIKITSAKPLTRFLEKKGLGEGVRMGRGGRRRKSVWMYRRFRNAGKSLLTYEIKLAGQSEDQNE